MSIASEIANYATGTDQPHAVFSERTVLGAWLAGASKPSVATRLRAEDFAHNWHRELFELLDELAATDRQCGVLDAQAVLLDRKDPDTAKYLDVVDLVEWHAGNALGWHIDAILDAAREREEITLGQRIAARPSEAASAHAEYAEHIADLDRRSAGNHHDQFAEHLNAAVGRYSLGIPPAISTGMYDLDLLIEGLRPGGVTVVAARPGVGKSLLAVSIATNICKAKTARVGFISLEMSTSEVEDRIIAGETGIPVKRLRRGGEGLTQPDWLAIDHARESLGDWPLHIADGSHDCSQLRTYGARLAAQAPRSVLIVDYLQRVRETDGGASRERHITQVSNTIKDIAVDHDIAVLAIASMSRESIRRGGRPRMSDVRDSGAIESDADVMLLLWQDTEDIDSNIIDAIVDKNRHGSLGDTQFVRRGEVGRVDNLGRPGSGWAR